MKTYIALVLGIVLLSTLAVRWWYVALCGLVLFTVFDKHPDMPHNIGEIQGLNPWNFILLLIMLSWLWSRRREPALPPIPSAAKVLFCIYAALVLTVTAIALLDVRSLTGTTIETLGRQGVLVDGAINPLKYVTIGVLFFTGAANLRRVRMAMLAAVGSGMLYALMMFKTMKTRVFTIDYLDARRLTEKLIGVFANDLAQVMAFAICAAIVMYLLFPRRWQRVSWALGILIMLPPFISLKSRAGFGAFCIIWAVLGVVRWRRILLLMPIAIILTVTFVPSVQHRVLSGFGFSHHEGGDIDWDEVSAGRLTNIWPPIIDQIKKSPLIGAGRYAILRKSCYWDILAMEGEVPMHPHNAYLEILVDAGVAGLAVALSCAFGLVYVAWSLMRVQGNAWVSRLGVLALIAIIGLLSCGIAGSSFYPSESFVPYLCVWGAAMRVYAERRARAQVEVPALVMRATRPEQALSLR